MYTPRSLTVFASTLSSPYGNRACSRMFEDVGECFLHDTEDLQWPFPGRTLESTAYLAPASESVVPGQRGEARSASVRGTNVQRIATWCSKPPGNREIQGAVQLRDTGSRTCLHRQRTRLHEDAVLSATAEDGLPINGRSSVEMDVDAIPSIPPNIPVDSRSSCLAVPPLPLRQDISGWDFALRH